MTDTRRHVTECEDALLPHLDALYGYAMTISRDRNIAEDLLQDTYAHAAASYHALRDDSNIKGWLFTIMRNLWFQHLRHARSGPEFVALEEASGHWTSGASEDPETLYVRIWEREEIRSALEALPLMHREIIVLFDIEGFSYKEIAEMLECPVGTVMSRLARGRDKLKRILLARQGASFVKTMPGGS